MESSSRNISSTITEIANEMYSRIIIILDEVELIEDDIFSFPNDDTNIDFDIQMCDLEKK